MNHRTHMLFVLCALALVACEPSKVEPSKVEQCNAFIDEGNKAQTLFIGTQLALLSAESLKTQLDKIDKSVKALRDVKLTDAKLVAMRDKYALTLIGYGTVLAEMQPIARDKARVYEFGEGIVKLDEISTVGDKLSSEINAYCRGGK